MHKTPRRRMLGGRLRTMRASPREKPGGVALPQSVCVAEASP
ncbi:hypothetical protein ANDA3_0498 [plant metagenome]|uniref:Uncharacterized protein n=2 Tax=root TaxID=1 RepID=A0A1C3K524_9BURK|nr:hypothetical protein ODI_04301 [Orrella dioscoreae]SOE46857.1 hypothetical protein ODI_R0503 [Orrella dioscoreae]